jgi:hypothetical protein
MLAVLLSLVAMVREGRQSHGFLAIHVPTSLEPFAFARRDKHVRLCLPCLPIVAAPNRVPCYNVTAVARVLLRQLTITPTCP